MPADALECMEDTTYGVSLPVDIVRNRPPPRSVTYRVTGTSPLAVSRNPLHRDGPLDHRNTRATDLAHVLVPVCSWRPFLPISILILGRASYCPTTADEWALWLDHIVPPVLVVPAARSVPGQVASPRGPAQLLELADYLRKQQSRGTRIARVEVEPACLGDSPDDMLVQLEARSNGERKKVRWGFWDGN